jgi:REP element-mobilizing transposase RayT
MARLARVEFGGAIYHVTVRGNNRRELFVDDRDRVRFLEKLAEGAEEFGVRVYAFCLMANHVHLVVETPEPNLGRFMHKLETGYTVFFNRRHQQSGHLTQGRYKAKPVEGDEYLQRLVRYVHLNPVFVEAWGQRPLKERLRHLRAYRWSSYRRYLGRREWAFVQTGPLLALQTARGAVGPRSAFRRFVEAGAAESDEEFREALRANPLGVGAEDFRDRLQDLYAAAARGRKRGEDVSLRRVKPCLSSTTVVEVACRELGVAAEEIRRRRRGGWVRAVVARALTRHAGLTQREVAELMGLETGKAVSVQLARLAAALPRDRRLRRQVAGLDVALCEVRR